MSPITAPGSTPFSARPLNFRGTTQQPQAAQTAKNPLVTGGQTIVSFRGNGEAEQAEEPPKSTPFYKKAVFWIGAAVVGAAAWFFLGGNALKQFKAITPETKDLPQAIKNTAKAVLDATGENAPKLAENIGEMTGHLKDTVKTGIEHLAGVILGHEGCKNVFNLPDLDGIKALLANADVKKAFEDIIKTATKA